MLNYKKMTEYFIDYESKLVIDELYKFEFCFNIYKKTNIKILITTMTQQCHHLHHRHQSLCQRSLSHFPL
jgi:hypothetical protein